MKHILTVLLICLSSLVYGQDFSKILKGEWLVSPNNTNAAFTQTWDFTSDNTLVITRKDSTQEKFSYEIEGTFFTIRISTTDSLGVAQNDEAYFLLYQYSETNFVGYDMTLNSDIELMFTQKQAINLTQPSILLDEALFAEKTFLVSSSKDSKDWHNKLIRSYSEVDMIFIEDTCIKSREYLVINTPQFSMLTFGQLGSIQIIEKRDSSWIKAISLNDKNDTITFELIENTTDNFAENLSSFKLKELKREHLNDFLNGRSILSVGMGTLEFFENGKGKFKSSSKEFELNWFYFYDNIIIYEYEQKKLRPGRGGFSRIETFLKVDYLRLKQLENGKILATKLNCDEDKSYFIEK